MRVRLLVVLCRAKFPSFDLDNSLSYAKWIMLLIRVSGRLWKWWVGRESHTACLASMRESLCWKKIEGAIQGKPNLKIEKKPRLLPLVWQSKPALLHRMNVTLPISEMSTVEKLRAMEELWVNLTRDAGAYDSPAWHGDVLRERDTRVAEGQEACMKWEDAKRELRDLGS